jgi:hypothetical protein
MDIDLIETLMKAAPKNAPPVRVTYRVKGQKALTTREMEHRHYEQFVEDAPKNGYDIVRLEQVRRDS